MGQSLKTLSHEKCKVYYDNIVIIVSQTVNKMYQPTTIFGVLPSLF